MKDNNYGEARTDKYGYDTEEGKEEWELFHAVYDEDWNTARKLLGTSNARDLVEYIHPDSVYEKKNALHQACSCFGETPSDIVQAMLNVSNRAPLQRDNNGQTPLHEAIRSVECSSEEIIIKLIEACPRAASITSDDGWTPLHEAIYCNRSSNVICNILAVNPTAATATEDDGDTPLHLLIKNWIVPLKNSLDSIDVDENIKDVIIQTKLGRDEEIWIRELHQTALLLLQAATQGSIEDNPDSPFRPLYAAINNPRCPWSFVDLILRMDPIQAYQWDREQLLPIHVAAAATLSDDKIPTVIKNLLKTNPKFAEISDGKGRLPLHIAIRSEKSFDGGLEAILRAAPKGLNTRSIKTHLYPFLHAAVKRGRAKNKLQKFTTCFTLLMENPHLVSSGIPH